MPPKGSGSQASTLVARGGSNGTAGPRQMANSGAPARRRSSARLATRPGYFYAEDSSLITLTPEAVMYFAIGFIVVVFMLHVFGKIRGA